MNLIYFGLRNLLLKDMRNENKDLEKKKLLE